MADYLAENNLLFQSGYSSSYLYFSNFVNKNNEFENAMKVSTDEQLNIVDLSDDKQSKANCYTRVVSASVMSSEMSATCTTDGRTAFSYQSVVQK